MASVGGAPDNHPHEALCDRRLVALALEGSHRAFRSIVERHQTAIAGVVIGMLGAGAEADDVGQETFVRFYRSMAKFRGDSALATYLTRIAMNLSLNAMKRRKRLIVRQAELRPEHHQRPDDRTGAQTRLEQEEIQDVVRTAIAALDDKHRAVVVLRIIQDRSTKETAQILGLPEGTVLSRLSRAMKKLQLELAPWSAVQ